MNVQCKRTDAYFRGELNKFIQVAENHARNEKTQLRHCPCNACKNLRVFSDPTTIRSHVIVRGFVKDYTVWKKHGETVAPPQADNPLVEIVQDEDFNRLVYSYFMAAEMMTMSMTMMMMLMMMVVVLLDPMVMTSTVPWMVIVVMMNLTMVIFSASCCATPKRRYWLLVPGG